MRILAGDIGGTNTRLLLRKGKKAVHEKTLESKRYADPGDAIVEFLDGRRPPRIACLGIAGPVVAGRCVATNLPWIVDERALEKRTGIESVRLVNDLVAVAYGALLAPERSVHPLWGRTKPPRKGGNVVVLSPGTGLGEAAVIWDGERFHPLPTEGAHVDFAARNPLEAELRAFVERRLEGAHVSYERVVSGPGIGLLYDFFIHRGVDETKPNARLIRKAADRNAQITKLGLNEKSKPAWMALQLLASIFGAEAGNFALKTFALGGVLLCGNITHHIRSVLEGDGFRESFLEKGRLRHFLERIPVATVDAPDLGLNGAAFLARRFGGKD
jgi:glucokinase